MKNPLETGKVTKTDPLFRASVKELSPANILILSSDSLVRLLTYRTVR